jgi:hypothetical protein
VVAFRARFRFLARISRITSLLVAPCLLFNFSFRTVVFLEYRETARPSVTRPERERNLFKEKVPLTCSADSVMKE